LISTVFYAGCGGLRGVLPPAIFLFQKIKWRKKAPHRGSYFAAAAWSAAGYAGRTNIRLQFFQAK
jgi:hypothetical protein